MSSTEPLHLAFRFDELGAGTAVDWQQIQFPSELSGWLWVDMNFESKKAQNWIRQHSKAPEMACQTLFDKTARPGVYELGDHLLVVLRGVNLNEGARPEDMISIRVWIERGLIVTCHRRSLRSVRALAERAPSDADIRTPGELFTELVTELSGRIVQADEALAARLQKVEQLIEDGDSPEGELGEIRRSANGLRRYLGPQKEALIMLQEYHGSLLRDEELENLRLTTHRTIQSLEGIDFIREQVLSFQDELNNRMAAAQNSRMYLLSIVAAIFLPLTFATGLLGMNVGGIPFANSQLGFTAIVGISVAIAVVLGIYFKRRSWF